MPRSQSPPVWAQIKLASGMPLGQFDQIIRSGLARIVAIQFQPGMLQNGDVHGNRALDDGVQLRSVAPHVRLQFSHADHRPIPDAAIELAQTEVKETRTQKDGPVGPIGEPANSRHDPIVFRTDHLRGGMKVGGVALREDDPLDPQAIHAPDHHLHTLFRSVARDGAEMAMDVPNSEAPGLGRLTPKHRQSAATAKRTEKTSSGEHRTSLGRYSERLLTAPKARCKRACRQNAGPTLLIHGSPKLRILEPAAIAMY